MFCFNSVDTRCRFNATSVRRRIDVETTSSVYRGGGFILCHRSSLGKPSWFAPKSK